MCSGNGCDPLEMEGSNFDLMPHGQIWDKARVPRGFYVHCSGMQPFPSMGASTPLKMHSASLARGRFQSVSICYTCITLHIAVRANVVHLPLLN